LSPRPRSHSLGSKCVRIQNSDFFPERVPGGALGLSPGFLLAETFVFTAAFFRAGFFSATFFGLPSF